MHGRKPDRQYLWYNLNLPAWCVWLEQRPLPHPKRNRLCCSRCPARLGQAARTPSTADLESCLRAHVSEQRPVILGSTLTPQKCPPLRCNSLVPRSKKSPPLPPDRPTCSTKKKSRASAGISGVYHEHFGSHIRRQFSFCCDRLLPSRTLLGPIFLGGGGRRRPSHTRFSAIGRLATPPLPPPPAPLVRFTSNTNKALQEQASRGAAALAQRSRLHGEIWSPCQPACLPCCDVDGRDARHASSFSATRCRHSFVTEREASVVGDAFPLRLLRRAWVVGVDAESLPVISNKLEYFRLVPG